MSEKISLDSSENDKLFYSVPLFTSSWANRKSVEIV